MAPLRPALLQLSIVRVSHRLFSIRRPADIDLPMDKIEFSYARSSGPGGQNVNKVNTKAEMRFHVMTAEWIPMEVRERFCITWYGVSLAKLLPLSVDWRSSNRTR
jgi:hypothetical protein